MERTPAFLGDGQALPTQSGRRCRLPFANGGCHVTPHGLFNHYVEGSALPKQLLVGFAYHEGLDQMNAAILELFPTLLVTI